LRILVLTHEFPPVGGGGARVIQDLCLGLADRGHELRVLTTHLAGLPRWELDRRVQIHRIPCGRQVPYRARFSEMAWFVAGGFGAAARLVRGWLPDVIHVHFAVPAGALAWALSSWSRVPYVLTVHGGDVPGGAPEKTARWFRWVYPFTGLIWRSAVAVVAVSEQTRQLALRHYPVQIRVIHNGLNLAAFQPGEARVGEPPQVIWAGRFMPEKNPIQVVRTLEQLRDLPWTCVMIGDGPEKARVEGEIARAGLADRFTVPGWVSQEEVMAWFARSDVLFMPSFREGLPIVGLQGLALGLAIVATRVGGFLDLVEPECNGYLVDNPNGSGFIEPLRSLLVDNSRLVAFRKASHRVATRFDIGLMIQAYEELLFQVVGRNA
jgi:glycosyltransferase involved in cell wall biosynthesis